MSLTSTPLLIMLGSLFVVGVVLLVVFWRYLAPNRVLPIVGRVAALLAINVLLVLTAAVALNVVPSLA